MDPIEQVGNGVLQQNIVQSKIKYIKSSIHQSLHGEVGLIRDLIQHVKLNTQFLILSLGLQPLASYITRQAIQAA